MNSAEKLVDELIKPYKLKGDLKSILDEQAKSWGKFLGKIQK